MSLVKEIEASAGHTPLSNHDLLRKLTAGPARPAPQSVREELDGWVRRVKQAPEIRVDLVRRVRAEIDAGEYETPERIEKAVKGLIEDLGL